MKADGADGGENTEQLWERSAGPARQGAFRKVQGVEHAVPFVKTSPALPQIAPPGWKPSTAGPPAARPLAGIIPPQRAPSRPRLDHPSGRPTISPGGSSGPPDHPCNFLQIQLGRICSFVIKSYPLIVNDLTTRPSPDYAAFPNGYPNTPVGIIQSSPNQ